MHLEQVSSQFIAIWQSNEDKEDFTVVGFDTV
jgi:hypothetical protein